MCRRKICVKKNYNGAFYDEPRASKRCAKRKEREEGHDARMPNKSHAKLVFATNPVATRDGQLKMRAFYLKTIVMQNAKKKLSLLYYKESSINVPILNKK